MTGQHFPRISVITPAYKAEKLIEFTIRSVLDQEYPNLEYIVLDGAGDNTDKILRRYDSRLAYWRSRPDGGQYEAINEGFARATGDIFCWINADDLLLPRSLFVVAEIFEKFSCVKWMSTLRPGYWDANSYLSHFSTTPGFSREAFLAGLFLRDGRRKGYFIQQESTFFTRDLWEKAGAKIPNYRLAGDFSLWCEFYKHTELYGIDYPLAGFRFIEGQRSEAMDVYLKEAGEALLSLREHQGWTHSFMESLRFSRYTRRPKINRFIKKRFGYDGKRIINTNKRKIGATWEIQDYKFLPYTA
jgi:glycosyltransferase involved in cell wall biosynthesis